MTLHESINALPSQIGVYIFWQEEVPLYIGKSVNIRARVKSHVQQARLSKKEAAIIEHSTHLTHLTTLSNFDALILEAKLIQKHKPKYNVLWKDDKHYLYIKITRGERYPRILPVRRENDGLSLYFGPFRSTYMTERLLYELRKIVPFCTTKKIMKRPCFYARIGMCNPCPSYIDHIQDPHLKAALRKKYLGNTRKIVNILSGRTDTFARSLQAKIRRLSLQKHYEEAIQVRNKLFQFSIFLDKRSFNEESLGVNINLQQLHNEIKKFLQQEFSHPIAASYRLECYDISNLFGEHPTGSMVVYKDGAFSKKDYRKFSVNYKGISDIRMMQEMIKRRTAHREWPYPDLIILDGGKPQLSIIYKYFRQTGISIPLISIAKRPDRIITARNNFKPMPLSNSVLLFNLFQSLRDESHRFAKKYHVLLRNRNLL